MDNAKNQASHLRIPKVGMSFKKKKKKRFSYKGNVAYPRFQKFVLKLSLTSKFSKYIKST